ncbi:MAG: M4 family metallopeptidase [Bacteroidota bacterium]
MSGQIKQATVGSQTHTAVSAEQWKALIRLQNSGARAAVEWNNANGTPAFLAGKLTSPGYLQSFPTPQDAAMLYVQQYHDLFKLNTPSAELLPLSTERDELGMSHVRLQQSVQGLRIVGSQLIVHFTPDGSVSSVNGRYYPTPQISTTASVSPQQARMIASQAVRANASTAELVVYIKQDVPVLAYEVSAPTPVAPKQRVTVDAMNGSILDKDDGIRYDGPFTGSGPGVLGTNRSLNIYQLGSTYYLVDATKAMYVAPADSLKGVVATYDAQNDTVNTNPYTSAALVSDPNGDRNFNDNARLAASVDAHFFTGKVYDYYKTHFNRNSWNNAGGSLLNVVHYLSKYNNAFWNGTLMTYGDGDGVQFTNLAGSFDVIVHEITHGVTEATANLEYRGQSGALNESYSDVMACMADSGNWRIGEDIYTPSIAGDALRDMSNPHQGGANLNSPGWQPALMSEYLYWPYTNEYDQGGVHTNSGIPNYAAYLVSNTIGHAKTEQLYYRTLTHYLTPKSVFIDARLLTLQSAADLYPGNTTVSNAVALAFDSVGIVSNLPRTDELSYDDGSAASGVYEDQANWGLVNRFTAPGSGQLMTVEFLYTGEHNSGGNGSFVLKVFSDNAGQPGTNIFTSSPITPSGNQAGYWFNGNVSALNIHVSGDFYAGLFYDGTNQPMVGGDAAPNNRAWEWDVVQGKWINLNSGSYFPVTLFIRAIVNTPTAVHELSGGVPKEFSLVQNFPNPFNPSTKIQYGLAREEQVVLNVYDALGREVAELVNTRQPSGTYTVDWKGVDNRGTPVSSGTYFYRLQTSERTLVRKMLLLR